MYDNKYSVIIVLIGFFIIFYIIFSSKNNRKYKVYKTKNYDIKKSINIKENIITDSKKNLKISILDTKSKNKKIEEILFPEKKQKQMSLSLGFEEEKKFIVINSISEKYYTIKDIYNFMDNKNIFLNDIGFFNKYHIYKHTRCIKYSITNIANPGFLDKDKVGSSKIKGLSFFIQLPMKIDPMDSFNEMMIDVKLFRKKYGGKLYDSNKDLLSKKTIKNLKNIVEIYKNEY